MRTGTNPAEAGVTFQLVTSGMDAQDGIFAGLPLSALAKHYLALARRRDRPVLAAVQDGVPRGAIFFNRYEKEGLLLHVETLPEFRGRGVCGALVRRALGTSGRQGSLR